jgi:hypothetical protein
MVMLKLPSQGGKPFMFTVACAKAVLSYPHHPGRDESLAGKAFQLPLKMGRPSYLQKMMNAVVLICILWNAHG